ncbi:unnamed protein product [Cylindrotheca closterium]|uniref:Uncharacterized protein n=1 Tax=Cylindrotheca closterium TaxID=2856 RepID=A0AAD2G5I4_9STRA|nr:unnamed protein product [Cylindrotheca closterium]
MTEVLAARVVDSDDESEENGSNRKPLMICVILVLVLGIGGVLAWFFLTQNESSPGNSTEIIILTSPTVMPSQPPSWSPSSLSSANPTGIPLLFDPPSQAECSRILNRQPVSNQDSMIVNPFGLDFDITVVEDTDTALWIATFMASVIRNLVPELTGCTSRRLLSEEESSNLRKFDSHHRNLNEIRYAIGNVDVNAEFQLGRACEADAPAPCFRFVVKMDLYLKDTLTNFQLIELVANVIDPPGATQSLVQRMGLPTDVFREVEVVLLGSTSESPTGPPVESSPPTTTPATN